eukprot:TRINITY_DN4375_c0_g1_i1.p1 TRINITY_DN4375_c0_g1~~TRINITY_DN4375_c0_g1_i1.p1  ORF type:complete len:155 (-),score=69.25 TRINITY_DN4375_c0_g1_i1:24-434(-)
MEDSKEEVKSEEEEMERIEDSKEEVNSEEEEEMERMEDSKEEVKSEEEEMERIEDSKEEVKSEKEEDEEKNIEEQKGGNLCVICFENIAEFTFYPCGHICICEIDAIIYKEKGWPCPVCLTVAIDIFKTFQSGHEE